MCDIHVEHSVQNTADNKEVHARQCFALAFCYCIRRRTDGSVISVPKISYAELDRNDNQNKKQYKD